MKFNISTIEDLAISAYKDLIKKQKELEIIKSNLVYLRSFQNDPKKAHWCPEQTTHDYIISSREKEISGLKEMLSKYTVTIREEKLKQLGI